MKSIIFFASAAIVAGYVFSSLAFSYDNDQFVKNNTDNFFGDMALLSSPAYSPSLL